MRLLTDIDARVHKVDDTILNELQQYPQPPPLTSDTLLSMVLLIVFCPHTSMKLTKLWFSSLLV